MVSRKDAVKARIKQAREACGLTMRQMAKAIGVAHDVTIARYESGVREPDWDTLERIAQATKRDIAWFFQAEDAASAPAEPPAPQPDMQSLLAQLVAAQTQMLQAQVRAEERQAEMHQALTALAHEQMQTRAEAARTSARLTQVEEGLRAMLEAPRGGCGEDEATLAG